jgi:hypothetical protein
MYVFIYIGKKIFKYLSSLASYESPFAPLGKEEKWGKKLLTRNPNLLSSQVDLNKIC